MSIIHNFPLFDILFKNSKQNDLTKSKKMELLSTISLLDTKGIEFFFLIIKIYSSDTTSFLDVPYKGEQIENKTNNKVSDYKFNLEEFPFHLKQILYAFVKLHLKSMREEQIREL